MTECLSMDCWLDRARSRHSSLWKGPAAANYETAVECLSMPGLAGQTSEIVHPTSNCDRVSEYGLLAAQSSALSRHSSLWKGPAASNYQTALECLSMPGLAGQTSEIVHPTSNCDRVSEYGLLAAQSSALSRHSSLWKGPAASNYQTALECLSMPGLAGQTSKIVHRLGLSRSLRMRALQPPNATRSQCPSMATLAG